MSQAQFTVICPSCRAEVVLTEQLATRLAGTETFSSVRGFWARRAARSRTSKTPNSRNSSRLPRESSSMISSRKAW